MGTLGFLNVYKAKVKIYFFLIKLAMIKMVNPLLESSVFYFMFSVATDVSAIDKYIKATKPPRAEARESS